jgi:hypothetical protein
VVVKGGPVVTGASRGIQELLMVRLSVASSLRRRRPAAATHDQTVWPRRARRQDLRELLPL